jgi:hypothetical protein
MVDTIRCSEEVIGCFVKNVDDDVCPDEEFARVGNIEEKLSTLGLCREKRTRGIPFLLYPIIFEE